MEHTKTLISSKVAGLPLFSLSFKFRSEILVLNYNNMKRFSAISTKNLKCIDKLREENSNLMLLK